MPRKYQNGKLEIRLDVERPYYFLRITVPRIDRATGERRLVRVQEKLGVVADISRKKAMELRAKVLERVNAHRSIAQSFVTFGELADRYIAMRVPQLAVPTQDWETIQIRNHLLTTFGPLKLGEIDRLVVEQWLASKSNLSWWTRNGLRRILARVFNAANEWNLREGVNPVYGVRLGRKTVVYERRLLTVEQLRTLLAALPERPKFIILIIFGLGLRISEVLGLRWSDIDFAEKTIAIRRRWYRGDLSEEQETKTEASTATLRLGASMLGEFEQRYPGPHKRHDFLFDGPPDDRDLLREEFRPVLKRLGLYYKGFGWHAFRRQNISWRQQIGGATPFEAQRAARHASLDMTYLYSLSDAERETAQQQAMFDKLMELPDGTKQ